MPLDERSETLRDQVLSVSGGWLGEIVIVLADITGAWDIFILMAIFVAAWVVLRTTNTMTSAVMGLVFDLGIPLQYQSDEDEGYKHDGQFSGYWPIFIIASLIELGGYMTFHPNLFTLVVCMKTTLCTIIWLTKEPNGSVRPYGSTRTAATPSAGGHGSHYNAPFDPRPPAVPYPPQEAHYPFPHDPRFPDADKDLKAAGYEDPLAREGFIYHLLGEPTLKRARHNLRTWIKQGEKGKEAREKKQAKYRQRALDERALLDRQRGVPSGGGGGGGVSQAGVSGSNPFSGDPRFIPFQNGYTPTPGPGPARPVGPGSTGAMILTPEKIAQLDYELNQEGWRNPEERSSFIDHLKTASSPEQLRDMLAKQGFLSQVWKSHNLDRAFRQEVIHDRRSMLVDGDRGLGVPQDIADLMIDDMLNQKSVERANALWEQWVAICQMPRTRQRTNEIIKLIDKYKAYVGQAAKHKSKRLGFT